MRDYIAIALVTAALLAGCATPNTVEKKGFAITKVNRTFLDTQGYETDAIGDLKLEAKYQFTLRHEPARQKGFRYHIKWKAPDETSNLRLQLDLRGLTSKNEPVLDTFSADYPRMDGWAEWTTIDIKGERFKRLGTVTAWKVSLFAGGQLVAELPSANWYPDIKPERSNHN